MTRTKAKTTKNPREFRLDAIRKAMEHFHEGIDALVRALSMQETHDVAIPREVMKPSDYADYMRVNVRKVHTWVKKGMPHFLLEGRVRIRVSEADAWLASRADTKGKDRS